MKEMFRSKVIDYEDFKGTPIRTSEYLTDELYSSVVSSAEKYSLSEDEKDYLINTKKTQGKYARPSLLYMIFGILAVSSALFIPLNTLISNDKLIIGIFHFVIILSFVLLFIIKDESTPKKVYNEISAFLENKYSAYKLKIGQKMWCSEYIGSDDNSSHYTDCYYIKCSDIIIQVCQGEFESAEAGNDIILVVFELQKGKTVEKLLV